MAKCQSCGKGPQFGHNVSHSHLATNKKWQINIQKTTVIHNGHRVQMRLCTRCIRTMAKAAV